MDVVNTILNPLAEVLMEPVKEHFRCMVLCRKYVRDMRAKMRELNVEKVRQEAHFDRNKKQHLEVPPQVEGWLADVEIINEKVVNFPDEVGCCDLKSRHKLGREAFKILEEIKSLTTQCSSIEWTDKPIPLGRIDSTIASSSMTSSDCSEFPSRKQTYSKALEALGPNHASHMVALCGMGGVGKTTLMKMLKQEVVKKRMFTDYAEVVVGQTTDLGAIQKEVAEFLDIKIVEGNIPRSTEMMRQWFTRNSDGGRKKFFLILDDVWESFKLEDIGLSLLPNQGVYFKVLITSRDQGVCFQMKVERDSVLDVRVLEEAEARSLFYQSWEPTDDVDSELREIGARIVRKCRGLPIAIKTMARTLGNKGRDAWEDALSRLENQDVEQHDLEALADAVFETSYVNLREEDKAIFLLCSLFPEDFNIPTEDLLRYGWGLKLFNQVGTIKKARTRLNACTERLVHTNLLIASDEAGCIKMHDLVRAFVVNKSKGEHASIVNHGSNPGWSESDMDASCKRISLTCKGMSEFPTKLEFPNLSILKLMHGDYSLKFRKDFYGGMEKLQVISYDRIEYPLLPPSPHQRHTNLRVLLLHRCSLEADLSSIGNFSNLEVLSFANSYIIKSLPYSIGNFHKLRVLDLTGCNGLSLDFSVFKNLVSLEELYAFEFDYSISAITFTGDDCNEVAERWNMLSALEFQFLESNSQWKNLSFENLERFKVSVGSSLSEGDYLFEKKHLSGNALKLVAKKDEVLGSGINKLFEKTVVLSISVEDIKDIESVWVKSSLRPQSSSFCNLRTLIISECAELEYLFTLGSAKVLSNLEHLQVVDCRVMKELLHTEGIGEETITFPKLKFLSLRGLPELLGLCQNVNMITITLPQLEELYIYGIPNITSIYPNNKSATTFLLTEKVVIPKLEKLHINDMMNLKEICPCDFRKEVKLREIIVESCGNLVNLFPCNPMPLLRHLEELKVHKCGSVEALFDIDLDCVGEIEDEECSSSRLRRIDVRESVNLREVWMVKGGENNSSHPIRGFQAVESITIRYCKMFRFVFTPTTTNLDLGALTHLDISDCWRKSPRLMESSQEQEINILSKEETSEISAGISYTMFPSCLIHSFHNLRKLALVSNHGVEVVFEIESTPRSQGDQQRILPYLEELKIENMEIMSHVWKCNWKEFFILQKSQSESPFNNLTIISMYRCHTIKYLFSPLMANLLSNLKEIKISSCNGIEEVVSHRDDEDTEHTTSTSTSTHTSTTLFPRLESLTLSNLQNLKCICGGGNNEISFSSATNSKFSPADGVSRTLCLYPREISITRCHALISVIPCYARAQIQKLQVLKIESCDGMKEVFETQGIGNGVMTLKLTNLKVLEIMGCDLLEHAFTFSTFKTLEQLEELRIERCKAMKVIVEEEQTTMALPSKAVVFPRLKFIELKNLTQLVCFFLGTNTEFHWPSLDHLTITDCPQMKTFTAGGLTAPQLKYVQTNIGKYSPPGSWFNSHMTTTSTGQHQESTNLFCPASTSEEINVWPYHNMIEIHVKGKTFVEKIIVPSSELLHLQKLEKIHVSNCDSVEEVFEELEGTNSTGSDESPTVVNLPNLREVDLRYLVRLRYMWKMNRWTVFEFPNLTKVSISWCKCLQHIFTTSMVRSLNHLQQLSIEECHQMEEVIVKDANAVVDEAESDGKMNEIVLPHLKSLKLDRLSHLKGFCLGMEEFSFPLLDTLTIKKCPSITTFTTGKSCTPKLERIKTGFGLFYLEEDINSFINMKEEVGIQKTQILIYSSLRAHNEDGKSCIGLEVKVVSAHDEDGMSLF